MTSSWPPHSPHDPDCGYVRFSKKKRATSINVNELKWITLVTGDGAINTDRARKLIINLPPPLHRPVHIDTYYAIMAYHKNKPSPRRASCHSTPIVTNFIWWWIPAACFFLFFFVSTFMDVKNLCNNESHQNLPPPGSTATFCLRQTLAWTHCCLTSTYTLWFQCEPNIKKGN